MIEIVSDKEVVTRKSHICFACQRKFEKNNKMKVQTGKYDGDIYNVYSCETCNVLLKEFSDRFYNEDGGVYSEGCVRELYHDYKTKSPEELLYLLKQEKYERTT